MNLKSLIEHGVDLKSITPEMAKKIAAMQTETEPVKEPVNVTRVKAAKTVLADKGNRLAQSIKRFGAERNIQTLAEAGKTDAVAYVVGFCVYRHSHPNTFKTKKGRTVTSRSVHVVYDGLNSHLRSMGVDPIAFLAYLEQEKVILQAPAKGGRKVMLPENVSQTSGNQGDWMANV